MINRLSVMKTKKLFIPIILVLSGVVAGVLVWSAVFAFTGFSLFGGLARKSESSDATRNADLTALSYNVLEYIRDDDFVALSQVVHPEFGLVFTPYATIRLSTDRRFGADQIATLNTDDTVYIWGVNNGSGEPIEMTPSEYIEQFVAAGDYLEAPVIGVNQIVRSGNALENITEVFPDVKFVDFHLSGTEGDMLEDYDWSSLRLGFEEYEGNLWLVVIVNSRWTA